MIDDREFMADPLDQAAALSQSLSDDGVAAASRLAAPEQVQNSDGSWPITECVSCYGDLGPRLALGKVRCLRCQEIYEKRRRGFFTVQQ